MLKRKTIVTAKRHQVSQRCRAMIDEICPILSGFGGMSLVSIQDTMPFCRSDWLSHLASPLSQKHPTARKEKIWVPSYCGRNITPLWAQAKAREKRMCGCADVSNTAALRHKSNHTCMPFTHPHQLECWNGAKAENCENYRIPVRGPRPPTVAGEKFANSGLANAPRGEKSTVDDEAMLHRDETRQLERERSACKAIQLVTWPALRRLTGTIIGDPAAQALVAVATLTASAFEVVHSAVAKHGRSADPPTAEKQTVRRARQRGRRGRGPRGPRSLRLVILEQERRGRLEA